MYILTIALLCLFVLNSAVVGVSVRRPQQPLVVVRRRQLHLRQTLVVSSSPSIGHQGPLRECILTTVLLATGLLAAWVYIL